MVPFLAKLQYRNMIKNSEQIKVEFNDRARCVFFSLYQEFESHIIALNREKDENVFQKLQSRYVEKLKQELGWIAREIAEKYRALNDINQVHQSLIALSENFQHEFVQKIRSL